MTPVLDAESLCDAFRHSGWRVRRQSTLSALRAADTSKATIERFCSCGSKAWVMQSASGEVRYRLSANRCRNRWCVPCQAEKRMTIQSNIRDACDGRDLRFMTLTLRSADASLSSQVTRLRKSFRKLRQVRELRGRITGGVYFIELTRNADRKQWHPHLHILFEGSYIAHADLKRLWLQITGDSFVVDIRKIPNSGVAAGYVSKYAGKPLPSSIVDETSAFVEAMEALAGSRTFHVFGDWNDLQLSKPPADDVEWTPFMPLAKCIQLARAGDERCVGILKTLRGAQAHEPMEHEP